MSNLYLFDSVLQRVKAGELWIADRKMPYAQFPMPNAQCPIPSLRYV